MSRRRRHTDPRSKSAPRLDDKTMAGQVAAARYDEAMFVMRLRDATDRARAGAPISRPEWSGILMRAQQAMSVSHWRRTMRVEIDRQTALAAYLARFETWEQAATGAVA